MCADALDMQQLSPLGRALRLVEHEERLAEQEQMILRSVLPRYVVVDPDGKTILRTERTDMALSARIFNNATVYDRDKRK